MKVEPIGNGGIKAFEEGEVMAGLQVRGRLDQSNGYGFGVLGAARLGEPRRHGGIYQRRRYGYNNITGPPRGNKGIYFVKMRSFAPNNPRTTLQQAHRQKFADGMTAWKNLTAPEKNAYNERANRKGRLGRWLFMSDYLKSH